MAGLTTVYTSLCLSVFFCDPSSFQVRIVNQEAFTVVSSCFHRFNHSALKLGFLVARFATFLSEQTLAIVFFVVFVQSQQTCGNVFLIRTCRGMLEVALRLDLCACELFYEQRVL